MFRIGDTFFLNNDDFENRSSEINPFQMLSSSLKRKLEEIRNPHRKIGIENYKKNELKEAVENLSKGLQIDQDDIEILYYKSLSLYGLGKYEEAIHEFTTILYLKTNFLNIYLYRAKASLLLFTYEGIKKALDDCIVFLEKKPGNQDAMLIKGACHLFLLQEDKAFQHWLIFQELGLTKEPEDNWKEDFYNLYK